MQMLNESPSNFVKICTGGGGFRFGLWEARGDLNGSIVIG
jgi:hypothetical protein